MAKNLSLYFFIIISLILIGYVECYFVLPLKTKYDYEESTKDSTKIMHNFLTNNIYTELNIGNPSQNLATFIKSKDFCSYIGSNLCNIENSNYDSSKSDDFKNTTPYNLKFKDFQNVCLANEKIKFGTTINNYLSSLEEVYFNQFYHAPNNSYSSDNPNTCGVFGLKYKADENIEGENNCINIINGLYENELLKNNIKNNLFVIKYSKNEENIDGKLIIGNYPHEYESNNYDKNNYVEVYLNETSLKTNNDFHTTFYEAYFYKNNKIGIFSQKVSINIPENLHSVFILEQNMFMVPQQFFDYYKDYFFKEYIDKEICELLPIDLSKYNTIICQKDKIESLTSFYETFPTLFLFHFGFNTTFEFTGQELLKEDKGILYFMLFTDVTNNDNYWGIGKIFLEKYLLTFDYGKNSIGYYLGTKENDDDDEEKEEFDFLKNGIYVILILGANILVIISCALYAIIHKCTKSSVDPTIMIESFSHNNKENLKQIQEEDNVL